MSADDTESACCPKCGGRNGNHGLVHVRHDNGGGHNRPCPCTPAEDAESTKTTWHARPNTAWRDTVTIERSSTGERLDVSVAEARVLSAALLVAADESEAAPPTDDTETQRVEANDIVSTIPLDEIETRRAEIEDWLIDNRWPNAYDLSDEIVKAPWFTAAPAVGDDPAVKRAIEEQHIRSLRKAASMVRTYATADQAAVALDVLADVIARAAALTEEDS